MKLDLRKVDALKAFKRYNHWYYLSWGVPPVWMILDCYPCVGCQGGYIAVT